MSVKILDTPVARSPTRRVISVDEGEEETDVMLREDSMTPGEA